MGYAIYVDVKRCTGCQACAVACMDQNDLDPDRGARPWRRIYQIEEGNYPDTKLSYLSLACMHCKDAPCMMGCPTGAIVQKTGGMVIVNQELCIGCHSCLISCPFGGPRYDARGKMAKCTMCRERVAEGLEPACVRVCSTRALKFGSVNELGDGLGEKSAITLAGAVVRCVKEGDSS